MFVYEVSTEIANQIELNMANLFFRCAKCDITFQSSKEARRHTKEAHLEDIIKPVR